MPFVAIPDAIEDFRQSAKTGQPQLSKYRSMWFRERPKDALAAGPQQVADHARQLDLALFERAL